MAATARQPLKPCCGGVQKAVCEGVERKNERLRTHAKSPCRCESVKDNEIAETKGLAVALAACGSHAVVNQNQEDTPTVTALQRYSTKYKTQ